MKVALLICDHVRADLVEQHGDYPIMFRRLLPELEMDDWFVCDGQFPSIADYDAFICTGSKYSVYEEIDWIIQLTAFTKQVFDSGKKFIGMCFGHQMIAHALGGKVRKSDEGYLIGVHHFSMPEQLPWTQDQADSFNVLMLCQDQVIELPAQAQVWASSQACPIGMFTVGTQVLAIQGHPEFSKAYNQDVFESRPEKIRQEKMESAVRSFNQSIDTVMLSRLINGFLRIA